MNNDAFGPGFNTMTEDEQEMVVGGNLLGWIGYAIGYAVGTAEAVWKKIT
jgi:hypothetical protein